MTYRYRENGGGGGGFFPQKVVTGSAKERVLLRNTWK